MLTTTTKTTNKVLTNVIDGVTIRYRYSYDVNGQLSSSITANAEVSGEGGLVKTLNITSGETGEYRINSVVSSEVNDLNLLNAVITDIATIHADLEGSGDPAE
jgi:hypothetical protein